MVIRQSVLRFMPGRLRAMLIKILDIQAKMRANLDGQQFIIPLVRNREVDYMFFWTRSWKTDLIQRLANTDGIFVDIGANIGQTLLDLRITHPAVRYVGFEPNVTCSSYLKELIRANKFENCPIIPLGLSEENRVLPLCRRKDLSTDSAGTILSDVRPGWAYDVDVVLCFRFDDLYRSLGMKDIGFVKIDVEGAELEVLTGMRMSIQEYRPPILCEVLFTDVKADLSAHKIRNERLMQLLADLKYEVLQLIKSVDNEHVVDAKRVQEFPSAYWTLENKDLCDYLFIPEEGLAHDLIPFCFA